MPKGRPPLQKPLQSPSEVGSSGQKDNNEVIENLLRAQMEQQAQILELLHRVTQPSTQTPSSGIPVNPPTPDLVVPPGGLDALYSRFVKRDPPAFWGTSDYTKADEWLMQMEKLFRVFDCSGRQRVQLAAYMFRGTAESWWRTIEATYEEIDEAVAWDVFRSTFDKKFIPDHIKVRKVIEFEQLMQGDMSVAQYDSKFMELSRFAPELVVTEEQRVRRFIRGLSPHIKKDVTSIPLTTYAENLSRAYWSEESFSQIEAAQRTKTSTESSGPKRTQQGPQTWKGKKQKHQSRPLSSGGCQHCGRGHNSLDCPRVTGACYQCGQLGHCARDCPARTTRALDPAPLASRPPRPQTPTQSHKPLTLPAARPFPPRQIGPSMQKPPAPVPHLRPMQPQHLQHRPQVLAQTFAISKAEAEATPHVVEGVNIADMGTDAHKEYAAFEDKVRRTVYLDNLSPQVTSAVLRTALGQFGNVISTQFIPNHLESRNIPQCALVEMETAKQAKSIIAEMTIYPFMMSGMPRPVRARPAEVEMFADRPARPGRKINCRWVEPKDPDFEVAKKLKLLVRKNAAEASLLLKHQLEHEAKLAKQQAEILKANYKKYDMLDCITTDGTLNRLARHYDINIVDD